MRGLGEWARKCVTQSEMHGYMPVKHMKRLIAMYITSYKLTPSATVSSMMLRKSLIDGKCYTDGSYPIQTG